MTMRDRMEASRDMEKKIVQLTAERDTLKKENESLKESLNDYHEQLKELRGIRARNAKLEKVLVDVYEELYEINPNNCDYDDVSRQNQSVVTSIMMLQQYVQSAIDAANSEGE